MRWITNALWKAQCRVNHPLVGLRAEGFGTDLDRLFTWRSAPPACRSPSLCIVLTTHARPKACAELLLELARELPAELAPHTQVIVLIDRSELDYAAAIEVGRSSFGEQVTWLESTRWLGKPGFHLVHRAAFALVRTLQPQLTLFIQDDLSLVPGFFARALSTWSAIDDPRKAVLSLFATDDDEPHGRWVRFTRETLPGGAVRRTQWFDLPAFLVDQRFFELLDYRVFAPDPLRFADGLPRSSGVGEQLTRRLWGRGDVYQVVETLTHHGAHPSVMNADARQLRPMDNRPVQSLLASRLPELTSQPQSRSLRESKYAPTASTSARLPVDQAQQPWPSSAMSRSGS